MKWYGSPVVGDTIDFEELVDSLPDMIAIARPESDRFDWVSKRWTEVLGWSCEELTSPPFLEYLHPDDRELTTSTAREGHHEDARLTGFTNRYRHRDGSYRWLEWNASPLADGRTYSIARDVTEQRLARIGDVTQAYSSLLERLGKIGFWRSEIPSEEAFWSPQAYALLNAEPGTRPTRNIVAAIIHDDDRERVFSEWEGARANERPFAAEFRVPANDGDVRVLRVVGQPERGPTGKLNGYVGVIQDVTEQKLIDARLRESEKLAGIGTMAAGVAHEINNPLSFIYTNAQFLKEELRALSGPEPTPELAEMIELAQEIEDGSERIRRIVQSLRKFSRTAPDTPRALEVEEVVYTTTRLCRNELRHQVELRVDIAPALPRVIADESEIVQVLVNLVSNARQSLPAEGGHIGVRAFAEAGSVHIEVEDDGEGMDEATRARAFEPFFTTKPQGIGTGLGLSFSHGIVTRFGGDLLVRSTLGEGTCVSVVLPVAEGFITR